MIQTLREGRKLTDKIVIFCTGPDEDTCLKIARTLVEEKLVACVNLLPGIRSIYSWDGKVQDDSECLMVMKSRRPLFKKIRERIESLHTYDTPEVIAVPVVDGAERYLDWVDSSVQLPPE